MAPNNPLVPWGNDKTMNLNTLILTNIQSSPYFKVQLFELKTFHEVVDEIYYKVDHLEPWEKGSRKTAGQTGMCGGVRGVGAGGIVSSAYCLLFKLFTLKLTKKQVNNLITHSDSPYIRGLGFMYIRYSQPPNDLWDWYEPYLDDEEEIDVKAGGGHVMTIGEMLRQWLVKLEWYSTLFPRIPVPIQKDLDVKLRGRPVSYNFQSYGDEGGEAAYQEPDHIPDDQVTFGEAERAAQAQRYTGKYRNDHSNGSTSKQSPPSRRRSPQRRAVSPRRSPYSRGDDFSRDLERERNRQRREKEKDHKSSRDDRHRSRSGEKRKSRSHSRERLHRSKSRERKEYRKDKSHKKEKKSHKRNKEKHRDNERYRSRSRDRERSREYEHRREDERYRGRDRSRDRERDRRH